MAPGTSTSIATVRPVAMARMLVVDVGLPVVAYYGLHLLGAGDRAALLAATGVAGVRIAVSAARERTLNPFATVMLTVFGIGAVLTLVSGDLRFLLLKNSITTGNVGAVFLATVSRGRPLTPAAAQSFHPARSEEFVAQYRSNPRVRHGHRLSSTVWGAGLLLEALGTGASGLPAFGERDGRRR